MNKEYKCNRSLQRFELKAPDFDYLEREYEPKSLQKRRYSLQDDGIWARSCQNNKITASLFFVGDLLCQENQMFESENGKGYDFHYVFDMVSPILNTADFVIGNLETPICECAPFRMERYVSEQKYYNNAPISYLEAIADAGIDLVSTANNHDLDAGAVGLGSTIDHCRELGLIQTGTFKEECDHFQIINVNEIKIAVVSFTTSHNLLSGNYTAEGRKFLLNTYDRTKAESICQKAKQKGAMVVIALIHWGKEYKQSPNSGQREIARELAEIGYGLIVGCHPHVIQQYEEIITKDNKSVPVIYSLGNFVSHQRKKGTNVSLIFKADITPDEIDRSLSIKCSYIPCCTSESLFNKKYVVLPLCDETKNLLSKKKIDDYLNYIAAQAGDLLRWDRSLRFPIPDTSELNWKDSTHADEEAENNRQYDRKMRKIIREKYPDAITHRGFYFVNEGGGLQLLGLSKSYAAVIIPARIKDQKITSIRKEAFLGNRIIKKINFPSSVTVLNESVCEDCSSLEGVTLGERLRIIEKGAFRNCQKLSSMVIRFEVEEIKAYAFENCQNLRSIKIPPNVKSIDKTAFLNCPDVIIYGLKGSYAESYAKDNRIPFRILKDIDNLIRK